MNSKNLPSGGKPTNIRQLQMLQGLIEKIYIPLEGKAELRTTLQKFTNQIEHSSQQVHVSSTPRFLEPSPSNCPTSSTRSTMKPLSELMI